jgi:hypothetical protein
MFDLRLLLEMKRMNSGGERGGDVISGCFECEWLSLINFV